MIARTAIRRPIARSCDHPPRIADYQSRQRPPQERKQVLIAWQMRNAGGVLERSRERKHASVLAIGAAIGGSEILQQNLPVEDRRALRELADDRVELYVDGSPDGVDRRWLRR